MIATKAAVIVLCKGSILIFAIPPLSPQPTDFLDHNPTHISPLFTIPFQDGIQVILDSKIIKWKTISSWYFSSSHPFYFDLVAFLDSKLHRFKLIVKPDLSDASLHVINTSERTPYNFFDTSFGSYRICEDTLVSWWIDHYPGGYRCGVYTGLTSARFSDIISHGPVARVLLPDIGCNYHPFSCPATGRFVLLARSNRVLVLDFL